MTVGELILELKKYPEDMLVVCPGSESNFEPTPSVFRYEKDFYHWDTEDSKIIIPKNTKFILL
jgi:hypothetical protein